MTVWRELALGEFVRVQRGHDLPGRVRHPGTVPVMGSAGQSGWHDVAMAAGPGVVIGRSGASYGIVSWCDRAYWPLNTVLFVTDFLGNDPRFTYYFLRALDLSGYNVGSAQPSLNRNHIYPIRVTVPEAGGQRRIAELLGALDDKIALNGQMSQTLSATASALFRSWFVEFLPCNAGADRRSADGVAESVHALTPTASTGSELGTIPAGWRVAPIGDLVQCVGGSTPSTSNDLFWGGGTHRWATPKDLADLDVPVAIETERRITDAGVQQITSGLLPRGTVLLSSRAPIGYLAVTAEPMAVNQGFIAMVCDRVLPNWYVLHWTRQNMASVVARANGTTFMEISKRNFRPIPALCPPDQVLADFVRVVEPMHLRIEQNVRESKSLAALRDVLLPRLVSGTVQLRDAEKAIVAVL